MRVPKRSKVLWPYMSLFDERRLPPEIILLTFGAVEVQKFTSQVSHSVCVLPDRGKRLCGGMARNVSGYQRAPKDPLRPRDSWQTA